MTDKTKDILAYSVGLLALVTVPAALVGAISGTEWLIWPFLSLILLLVLAGIVGLGSFLLAGLIRTIRTPVNKAPKRYGNLASGGPAGKEPGPYDDEF